MVISWELFNIMVQNTQQFGTREPQFRKVNELSIGPSVETQLSQITAMLSSLDEFRKQWFAVYRDMLLLHAVHFKGVM